MVLGSAVLVAGGAADGRALYVVPDDAAGTGTEECAAGAAGEDRGAYVVTPFSVLTDGLPEAGAGVEDDPGRGA